LPTLEERVTRLEADMEEQKRLRAGQDDDLSGISQKLRAQDLLLKALAQTQSEHTATLAEHTAILEDHTRRFERLEGKVDNLQGKVDSLKGGMDQIVGMLDTLIERENGR
jgi:chromosome segregation ATPase